MSDLHHSFQSPIRSPIQSLREGHWFKLICGASFQHLPSVRSLALAYAGSGSDCVDVAADPAVVAAAKAGIAAAHPYRQAQGLDQPLLMVSLNDGEDPHFRKARFDPARCPEDCSRPCEMVCPAQAIAPSQGVIERRCYGCGRCLPVCPLGLITTRSHGSRPEIVMEQLVMTGVDAVEIHTQMGRETEFARLWRALAPWVPQLKLVAVSCPDSDRRSNGAYSNYLHQLYRSMDPKPRVLVWQTDGRPMSGDIGAGTTHAAVQLAQKLRQIDPETLPGFIQLAGGTNLYTVPKLRALGMLAKKAAGTGAAADGMRAVAGVAYGSFARSHLAPVLEDLERRGGPLEAHPELLSQSLRLASELLAPLKSAAARAGPASQQSVGRPPLASA